MTDALPRPRAARPSRRGRGSAFPPLAGQDAALVAAHLEHMRLRGLSPATIYKRQRDLTRLAAWLAAPLADATPGQLAAWRSGRLPMEEGPAGTAGEPRAHFEGRPNAGMVAATAEVEHAVNSGEFSGGRWVLVDARAADRFAGRNETLDPVAGHVPGACNLPFADNLIEGRFLPPERLRERFTPVLSGRAAEALVCMCGSGVTACHNLLALEAAGLRGARLYAGSWSEWIRDPRRPVARGS